MHSLWVDSSDSYYTLPHRQEQRRCKLNMTNAGPLMNKDRVVISATRSSWSMQGHRLYQQYMGSTVGDNKGAKC